MCWRSLRRGWALGGVGQDVPVGSSGWQSRERRPRARVLIAANQLVRVAHRRRHGSIPPACDLCVDFERGFCVWDDRAVSEKIPETEWKTPRDLTNALKHGKPREGFIEGDPEARRRVMAKTFPVQPKDKERALPNEMRTLD